MCVIAAAVFNEKRPGGGSGEAARLEAETNFDVAKNAVEVYLTNVSENTLLKEQDSVDIRGLRKELLKNALKYYERFVNGRSNDPALREQLADAYFRVGEITGEIDTRERAIDAFRKAQTIWESLIKANPEKDELSGRLAQCNMAIGKGPFWVISTRKRPHL